MRDLTLNNAISFLASSITSGASSFTLLSGGGALFPTPTTANPGNVIIAIDDELVLCAGFSSDTATVLQRGYDGTSAVSHATGAVVQQVMTAGMLEHLWSNTPDHLLFDVPPSFRGGSANSLDDEMEVATSWSLYPADGGLTKDYTSAASHVFFNRLTSTALYTYYKNFTLSGAYTLIVKLEQGTNLTSNGQAYAWFFVTDQSNPTGSLTSGNRVLVGLGYDATYAANFTLTGPTNTTYPFPIIKVANTVSSVLTARLVAPDIGYRYFKLKYDGSGTWTVSGSSGGIVWHLLATFAQTIVPATIGFALTYSGTPINQTVASDFVRVTQP